MYVKKENIIIIISGGYLIMTYGIKKLIDLKQIEGLSEKDLETPFS